MAAMRKFVLFAGAARTHYGRAAGSSRMRLRCVVPMSSLIDATGLVAACLTTFAFLPQVIQTWRSRSADGLNLPMLVVLASGIALWLAYGLATGQLPVILANGVTLLLVGVLLGLKLRAARLA